MAFVGEAIGLWLKPKIAYVLCAAAIATVIYIGWLRSEAAYYERMYRAQEAEIQQCIADKEALQDSEETLQRNMESLKAYYRERKTLNKSDGELSPDEVLNLPRKNK